MTDLDAETMEAISKGLDDLASGRIRSWQSVKAEAHGHPVGGDCLRCTKVKAEVRRLTDAVSPAHRSEYERDVARRTIR